MSEWPYFPFCNANVFGFFFYFLDIHIICVCVCVCFPSVRAGKGVGCGSFRLPWSDCRGSVFPQGGDHPSDGACWCWVEERETGGQGGPLPCRFYAVLPGYQTHKYTLQTTSQSYHIAIIFLIDVNLWFLAVMCKFISIPVITPRKSLALVVYPEIQNWIEVDSSIHVSTWKRHDWQN